VPLHLCHHAMSAYYTRPPRQIGLINLDDDVLIDLVATP
jgi:hypothetical protein